MGVAVTVKQKPSFKAIEPISLKDLALRAIKEAILGARFSPRERIAESRLSKQMRVGQNVVREALQELEFQGFVERVPNKGERLSPTSLARTSGRSIGFGWSSKVLHLSSLA